MLFYCFIVAGLIVLVSTLHLTWWKERWGIILSSVLLGSLVTLMVQLWGYHDCVQGKPPQYLSYVGGLLAGAVPWCHSFSVPIRRMLAFTITMLFVTMVGLLVSSYHSEGITGNSELANGRYWHTALTNMYPRGTQVGMHEQAVMRGLRERVHRLTHGIEEETPDEPSAEDENQQPQ